MKDLITYERNGLCLQTPLGGMRFTLSSHGDIELATDSSKVFAFDGKEIYVHARLIKTAHSWMVDDFFVVGNEWDRKELSTKTVKAISNALAPFLVEWASEFLPLLPASR